MLYEITDGQMIQATELAAAKGKAAADCVTLGCLTQDEFVSYLQSYDPRTSVLNEMDAPSEAVQNNLLVSEEHSFAIMNTINGGDIMGERDTVALYFSKNLFFVVTIDDKDGSVNQAFHEALALLHPQRATMGRFIYHFLKALTSEHRRMALQIQSRLETLDKEVLANQGGDRTEEISLLNHELLTLYGYYGQLIELGESLYDNDNDLFSPADLLSIKMFTARADRYSDNVKLLREYVSQIRESYQAQLDIGLNEVMKILTVVTAVFLPLTLIAGWYGMNFKHMPELQWIFGYPMVFLLSALVVVVSIYLFKKHKML